MTSFPDLAITSAWLIIAAFIGLGIVFLPGVLRDRRRDRARERAELTSEQIEERAVTTIHSGEFVRRK